MPLGYTATLSLRPSARTTFNTVANSGFPSGESALYRLSTPEAGRLRDLRHAFGAGDHAESVGDQRRVAVLEHSLQIIRDVFVGLQMLRQLQGWFSSCPWRSRRGRVPSRYPGPACTCRHPQPE